MEKLKLGILAIAVIMLIGGSYAVYIGNNVSNDQITDFSSDISTINPNTEPNNQFILEDSKIVTTDLMAANALEETYKQIPGTKLQIDNTMNYTDLYTQCPICGGYIALGEVTKTLPEGAICPDACGAIESTLTEGSFIKYNYEEAYALWEIYGDRQPEVSSPEINTAQDTIEPTDYSNSINTADVTEEPVYSILEYNTA
ncbi:hypothetical protein [Methanobrevibacter sp.]|uniref:hypothetical protein n=1 Tax=Methanobrevibacter sp. TaxID=66852 RepID=UPI00388DC5E7